MVLNKYKLLTDESEVLIYTLADQLEMPLQDLGLELVEESPCLESNSKLALLKAEDLIERILKHSRTRDVVLGEQSIDSWNNLKAAYFLMRTRKMYFSKRIRDFLTEKYSEIVNNYSNIELKKESD